VIYGGGEIGLGAKRQDSTLGDGEGSCAAGGEIRSDTKDAKDTKDTKDAPIGASLISGAAPSTGCAQSAVVVFVCFVTLVLQFRTAALSHSVFPGSRLPPG